MDKQTEDIFYWQKTSQVKYTEGIAVMNEQSDSTTSPAASALSKENPMAPFIWLLSNVKARSISSNSSLCASVSVLSGSTRCNNQNKES
jgi:hypothetical protein